MGWDGGVQRIGISACMGLHSVVVSDLRPALTAAAIPAQVATQFHQCERAYRSMAYVDPPGADRHSQPRPLETVIFDLIVGLEIRDGMADDQAEATAALQNLLYARLAMISAFRQLITPDPEPADISVVLDLAGVADSKKALLMDQIEAELLCLRKLAEVHNEIRDIQWTTAIVALTEAKAELARVRQLPFFRTYASLHWMAAYLGALQARAQLYFSNVVRNLHVIANPASLRSHVSNTSRKQYWSFQIENNIVKFGALCVCLIYNGLDADSRVAMLQGYQFPDQIQRPSGLKLWSCLYSSSSVPDFHLDSHMANIVCLLMQYGEQQQFGRAVLHREPKPGICYLYTQVEPRVFFVAIWQTSLSARLQSQMILAWTTLVQNIRNLPHPSQTSLS